MGRRAVEAFESFESLHDAIWAHNFLVLDVSSQHTQKSAHDFTSAMCECTRMRACLPIELASRCRSDTWLITR
jgi:hypothetical protein